MMKTASHALQIVLTLVLAILPMTLRALPDVTVLSVQAPGLAGTAQSLTLTNVFANPGDQDSGAFSYAVFLSGDTTITTSDVRLVTISLLGGLVAGQVATQGTLVAIPSGTATGLYYFGTIVDVHGQVVESNESNNAAASPAVQIIPGPDLVVASVKGPAAAATAQSISITNVLSNVGIGDAGSFSYRLFLSADALITTGDTAIATGSAFGALAAGQSVTNVTLASIPAGVLAGVYYFGAIVDHGGQIVESNESNNATAAAATVLVTYGPDLTVQAVRGPSSAGTAQSVQLTNVFANLGVGEVGSFGYAVYLSADTTISTADVVLATATQFGFLNPGQTMTNSLLVAIPSGQAAGQYYFGTVVDAAGQLAESNENNNTAISGPVAISVGPDLTVLSVSGPTAVTPSQTVTIASVLANVGVGNSGGFSFRLYLSADTTITTGDVFLANIVFPSGIGAGQTITNQTVTSIPGNVANGTWHYGTLIDSSAQVEEASETNNTSASVAVTVGGTLPYVSAIGLLSNRIAVTISGLVPPGTCTVLFATSLENAPTWNTGAIFAIQGAVSNWSEPVPPAVTSRFYRVRIP